MYKKHNAWDEDKWNIHSSGYSSQSSGSSGSSGGGAGYSSQGSKNPFEHYHKSEMYGSKEGDKIKDMYRSNEAQEEDKKKKEQGGEKTLADAVHQEEKYQKKQDQTAENETTKINPQPSTKEDKKEDSPKKENKKSIEEAISDAIKEEKEVIHLD